MLPQIIREVWPNLSSRKASSRNSLKWARNSGERGLEGGWKPLEGLFSTSWDDGEEVRAPPAWAESAQGKYSEQRDQRTWSGQTQTQGPTSTAKVRNGIMSTKSSNAWKHRGTKGENWAEKRWSVKKEVSFKWKTTDFGLQTTKHQGKRSKYQACSINYICRGMQRATSTRGAQRLRP